VAPLVLDAVFFADKYLNEKGRQVWYVDANLGRKFLEHRDEFVPKLGGEFGRPSSSVGVISHIFERFLGERFESIQPIVNRRSRDSVSIGQSDCAIPSLGRV